VGVVEGDAGVGEALGGGVPAGVVTGGTEDCEPGSPESEQPASEPAMTIAGKQQLTNRDHLRIAQVWHDRGSSGK
jgi:hypothetical protein